MMKLICCSFLFLFAISVNAQQACGFKETATKARHDQYSQSPKANADKSKKEEDQQASEFDKKKYQAAVKAKGTKKKKTTPRYY